MARFPAFVLVFLVVITPATAAEPDAGPVAKDATLSALGARPEESEEIRFRALVDAGDAARAKGRLREAALAYKDALDLRPSPLVRGRLGVLLVALGVPERAPEFLMDAIQLAGDASPAERQAFFRAYEEARALGTWVEVEVSHKGAAVALDDEKAFNDGQSACWIFVRAGEHVLRGQLEGHEDAVVKFTAQKGTSMRVHVDFRALPGVVPPAPEPCAAPPQPQKVERSVLVEEPGYSKQEDPFAYPDPVQPRKDEKKKSGMRASLGAGPVMVFGVATWTPAVGVVVGGSLRPNEHVSIGLEGRAAWVPSGVGGEPIYAMTAGALASVCGHYRWAFGCALGHLGVIKVDASGDTFKERSDTFVKPGIGGRLGVKFVLARSFALQGAVDVLGLSSGVRVGVEETVLSETPPLMVSTSIMGTWEF